MTSETFKAWPSDLIFIYRHVESFLCGLAANTKGKYMSYESLSHSKWDCKYHLVFVPKFRKKVLYGKIRQYLGPLFHELARQKECKILEGHMVQDHVHMLIAIPPKYSVAQVVGYIKGKSAIGVARQFAGRKRNFTGEKFWARG